MQNVVRIKFGSHLYGTNTPTSDLDFKSIHIPNCSDIVMQRVADSIKQPARRKVEGERNNPDDVDDETFALHRFFELCVKGETLALDMLFAPEESRITTSPIWNEIVRNRHRLISKKSTAFVGYCRTQANKYGIKGSRVKEAQIAYEFFSDLEREYGTTSKVGDHIGALERIITGSIHTGLYPVDEMQKPVESPTHFECCDKQVPLQSSVKVAREIYERVYNGYGDRAKKAQDNEGIDWKALSHAIRVGQEALELLNFHTITFPLTDRNYVRDVKLGKHEFKFVADHIERLLEAVEHAAAKSTLPETVDRAWIDEIVYKYYRQSVIETARWGAY